MAQGKKTRHKEKDATCRSGSEIPRLVDVVKAECFRAKKPTWFDKVPSEMRSELREVRDSFRRGEITVSAAELHRFLRQKGAVLVSRTAFEQWLKE